MEDSGHGGEFSSRWSLPSSMHGTTQPHASTDTLLTSLNSISSTLSRIKRKIDVQADKRCKQGTMTRRQDGERKGMKQNQEETRHRSTTSGEKPQKKLNYNEDENTKRRNWPGRFDFLIVCIGYVVGTGNIASFPSKCGKFGGATFLIPYIIFVVLFGLPIVFLEISLGQFTSSGPLTCWEFATFFRGVGYAMLLANICFAIYYNVTVATSSVYLAVTIEHIGRDLPWLSCQHSFNSPFCVEANASRPSPNCTGPDLLKMANGTCYNTTASTFHTIWNETLAREHNIGWGNPTEEYLQNFVLGSSNSDGLTNLGQLRWQLAVAYLVVWLLIMGVLSRGIHSMGKVLYVAVLFPFISLMVLFGRGMYLDPGGFGARQFLGSVDPSTLKRLEVWTEAANHVLFSFGGGYGVLISLASHNRFHRDVFRDAVVITAVDTITSIFSGFVVFSYITHLQHTSHIDVTDISAKDVIFHLYPDVVAEMSVPHLWLIMFFLMMICLGITTTFCTMEAILTGILDLFPVCRNHAAKVMAGLCIGCYLLGLVCCTEGGPYVITWIDHYMGWWNILFLSFLETVAVSYVYGARKFREDVGVMLGQRVCCCLPWRVCSYFWLFCWWLAVPALVMALALNAWVQYQPLSHELYVYPLWANILGWIAVMSFVIFIFLGVVKQILHVQGSFSQRVKNLLKPTIYWGPALVKHRKYCSHRKDFIVDPWSTDNINPNHPDIILSQWKVPWKKAEEIQGAESLSTVNIPSPIVDS